MKLLLTILFLLLAFTLLQSQNIQFQGEQIEIKVLVDQVQVTGTYYFYNPASYPLNRTVYYPFVVDHRLEYPDSIKVSISTNDQLLAYRSESDGIFLSIPFLPEQLITLKVFYSQKTLANQFEYVLTSTKEWGRPLQFASYIIQIPKTKELTHLSLDYQEIQNHDSYQIYSISRTDFMPQENLKIIWKE